MPVRSEGSARFDIAEAPGGGRCSLVTARQLAAVGLILTLVLGWVVSLTVPSLARDQVSLGVTYSPRYAASLGLDPRATYLRMLSDLDIVDVRLPIYWDEVEREPGRYDLGAVEPYVAEAGRRGVRVVPVLGYKVPRWPECYPPSWARSLSIEAKRTAILDLVAVEVRQLQGYQNVALWQIENEPFFPFGECDDFLAPDPAFLTREVARVRQLDARPVLITDSGELSPGLSALRAGDRFGSSLYRSIWFQPFGRFSYPLSPKVYAAKDRLARAIAGVEGESIVVELQGEPWIDTGGPVTDVPLAQQIAALPSQTLRDHVRFARETGAASIYLWGAEWWYWMEQQNHPEYVQEVRSLIDAARER